VIGALCYQHVTTKEEKQRKQQEEEPKKSKKEEPKKQQRSKFTFGFTSLGLKKPVRPKGRRGAKEREKRIKKRRQQ